MGDDGVTARWALFGDDDPALIIAGHSHAYSLMISRHLRPAGIRAAVAYSTPEVSGPPGDADYWQLVADSAVARILAICWNGNQHNVGFLIEQDPPVRVAGSGDGLPIIPRSELRALWEPSFDELRAFVPSLDASTEVYLLGTPPPKSDDFVASALASEEFFLSQARLAGLAVEDIVVTPAATRVALWRALQEQLAQVAVELGATFVPVPSAAIDADGTLLLEYCQLDVTHANAAYGVLVWAQLQSISDSSRWAQAVS